jgi:legumain
MASADTQDHWAVIVAGSKGFGNYRHQADTCHAYQILKANGIPEDHIIHMAQDDIANSRQNPFKGKLFNKPTPAGTPGVDVYEGCKIDYKGKTVTSENFLKVLTGDTSAGGPVLKSNENSKVFVYFADHGAPGLIAFPNKRHLILSDYLHADKLNDAFKTMHGNKMYQDMTVYIEACESGSMFQNILTDDLGIYAVSAANGSESSWGNYCSPDDKVNGKSVGSCLGDLFSTNWMEDADAANMETETLQTQYDTVQKETTKSHVLQWGDLTFTKDPIGEFEATTTPSNQFWWKVRKWGNKQLSKAEAAFDKKFGEDKGAFAVDSRDIQLHYLYNLVAQDPSVENHQALKDEVDKRIRTDEFFSTFYAQHWEAMQAGTTPLPTDFDCYRTLSDTYETFCEPMDDYSLKYMKAFVAECEGMTSFPMMVQKHVSDLTEACTQRK